MTSCVVKQSFCLYLRCPTMLIGTVDKFARLPWDDRTKALFGCVDRRCDRHGFLAEGVDYQGKCGGHHNAKGNLPATGSPKAIPDFLPPELIIQDELHLITGPLGSLMGLYESAIDFLCSHNIGHRPKIVASTAIIRRYRDQIRCLFDREARQFPPPGLIAGESFFATENKARPGRIFVGICPTGRSLKHFTARVMASILNSSYVTRIQYPGDVVDPYWTLAHYFNSLRELGGNLRLLEDTVPFRLKYLAKQIDQRSNERRIDRYHELTSRVPSSKIAELLKSMEQELSTEDALDVLHTYLQPG